MKTWLTLGKHGENINFSIQVPKSMDLQKVPSKVILPFVKNAVYNSLLLKKDGGLITITGYSKNKKLIFEIFNEGSAISRNEVIEKNEIYKENHEGHHITLGVNCAIEKMNRLYGEDYKIITDNDENGGQKCLIVIPEFYDESHS